MLYRACCVSHSLPPPQVLDTRQTFLNLCQGNHYQFDMLRRGKHSSMMVRRRVLGNTIKTQRTLPTPPSRSSRSCCAYHLALLSILYFYFVFFLIRACVRPRVYACRSAGHAQVLYHLCNPDVPKFLSTCSNCYKEIHSGDRYHCETCTDFDLCKASLSLPRGLAHLSGGPCRVVSGVPCPEMRAWWRPS